MSQACNYCNDFVKRFSYERYLSTLYAPVIARPGLIALYAFACEIARIRELVREPMPGEIRLQWWYDALSGTDHGDVVHNLVARAIIETIEQYKLPREPFLNLISARRFDLYSDPMPTINDLEGYCGETSSTLVLLASIILSGKPADRQISDASGHGGVAYALSGLMQTLAWQASRQQQFLPKDVMGRHGAGARALQGNHSDAALRAAFKEMIELSEKHLNDCEGALEGIDPSVLPAFLPVFQVELFFKEADKNSFEPLQVCGGAPHIRRVWHMWRTSHRLAKLSRK